MTAGAAERAGSRLGLAWVVPVLCFLAIGMCWVLSTPPGAGVDEPSHYVRVLGIAYGSLIGADSPNDLELGGLEGAQLQRVIDESGMFEIPGDLPSPFPCNFNDTAKPFDCGHIPPIEGDRLERSLHGRYLPGAYLFPAILARFGTTTWRVIVLARLGFLLQNTVLVAVAVLAVRRAVSPRSSTALGALLLCATPLVMFQAGTIAPNGTEIVSVIAFLAASLAALRARSRGWWWGAATVGVLACWTRDLGVADVVLFAAVALIASARARRWSVERLRSVDALAVALLALSAIGATVWQVVLKSSLTFDLESPARLLADLGTTIGLMRESIGLLGWLNIEIDPFLETLWMAAWITAVVVLVRRADRSSRIAAGVLALSYVIGSLLLLNAQREAGFGIQARYTVAVLIAGVVVLAVGQPGGRSRRSGGRAQWPLAAASVVAALGNLSGLLITAQHNAIGLGVPMSFAHPAWSPPGGWPLMLTMYALSCGSLLVLAPLAARQPRDTPAVG